MGGYSGSLTVDRPAPRTGTGHAWAARARARAPAAPRPTRRPYWNVTGKVSVLFELFFSPGTGATVAVTV
jgi:hypothetical protein